MNLAFTQKIKNKKTFFIEKIWRSFTVKIWEDQVYIYGMDHDRQFGNFWDGYHPWQSDETPKAKKHTIRADKSNRWKVGNKIHFIINNRSPNRFQFAPIHLVTKIQKIVILPDSGAIIIDDLLLTKEQKEDLYINDGFDSKEDFWAFFDEDFEGKIIHWTEDKISY